MKSVKAEFFERKKTKKFYKFMKRWLQGKDYSDIEVAKNISSMITHCIMDMEDYGQINYKALEIPEQVESLDQFIRGKTDAATLREIYTTRFGRYL